MVWALTDSPLGHPERHKTLADAWNNEGSGNRKVHHNGNEWVARSSVGAINLVIYHVRISNR
jgi:hypothetical protein